MRPGKRGKRGRDECQSKGKSIAVSLFCHMRCHLRHGVMFLLCYDASCEDAHLCVLKHKHTGEGEREKECLHAD